MPMSHEPDVPLPQEAVARALSAAGATSIEGTFWYAYVAFRSGADGGLRMRAYGCAPGVQVRRSEALDNACRGVLSTWGVAGADVPLIYIAGWMKLRGFADQLLVESPPWDMDPSMSDRMAFRSMDRTAVARAALAAGPGPFDDSVAESELGPHDERLASVMDHLQSIALGARRGTPAAFSRFVVDAASAMVHGTFATDDFGITSRAVCRSGTPKLARRALQAHFDAKGAPMQAYLLMAGSSVKDLRFRATSDGEVALRYLHLTEHQRLDAAGLMPRVRIAKGRR